jgi:VanZ family protein
MIQPLVFSISAARAALCATWMIASAILWFTLTPQALPKSQILPLDKVAHMAAFTALVLPVACMAPRSLWLLVPLALGLGGAIELLQPYVGRSREVADFIADAMSVVAGLILDTGLWQLWRLSITYSKKMPNKAQCRTAGQP